MTDFNTKIKSYKDLRVHSVAYDLALEVFKITQRFPKEEVYSLTGQVRRSSRSVAANIREGFAKRKYPNIFIRHLIDSIGSCEETREWLDFSHDFSYFQRELHDRLDSRYDEVSAMLYSLIKRWENL